MKVRPLEKDVYNYIQKCEVLPFNRISIKFGVGYSVLYSAYIDRAIVAAALSSELRDSLILLREQGNIFEVAVPPGIYKLLNGKIPSIPSVIPTVNFRIPKYRYGYQGPSWLPVLFCSERGLRTLETMYYNIIEIPHKRRPNLYYEVDKRLKGPAEDRRKVPIYLSELLAGQFSGPFRKNLDEKLKLIDKMGLEKFKKMLEKEEFKKQKKEFKPSPVSEITELHPTLRLF